MKKLLIFLSVLFLLTSAVSYATLTKALTMGDANNVIHDDANIWLYPSTFYNYPDLAIGEFNSSGFEDFGIHYKFGEDNPMILGFYFTTDQPFNLPNNYHLTTVKGWDMSVQNNDRIDFFFGYMMGENPIGLHVNYISGSSTRENDSVPAPTNTPPNSEEEGISNLAFDLGITMMEGKADIAAGINFLSWTDIDTTGYDETKPLSNFAFYVMGRYFHEMNQKVTLVPHVGFSSEKMGIEYFDNYNTAADQTKMTRERKFSTTIIDLGCGMNYSPAPGILAIGDVGFMMNNTKEELHSDPAYTGGTAWADQEYKENYTTLPYFRIGMDAAIFDWLDLRMGARSYWRSRVDEDKIFTGTASPGTLYTQKFTQSYVSNSTYLGAGFHWGNFKADCYVNPAIFTSGLNFISGNTYAMNYRVTVLYEMF